MGIKDEFVYMKQWLIEKKSWLSFKLIIFGIAFYESGLYVHYGDYGGYFELAGVIFLILGILKAPISKKVWDYLGDL